MQLGVDFEEMVKQGLAIGLWLLSASFAFGDPSYRAVLDKYCVTCHNQRLKTGGLTLDTMDLGAVPAHADVLGKGDRQIARWNDAAGGHASP